MKYLKLLAKDYPNEQAARSEIVRLKTYMELPKGTEYFFSDLHGEDVAFYHLMRSGSGNIRRKITDMYEHTLSGKEKDRLANLIYNPKTVLEMIEEKGELTEEWIRITILRLAELLRYVAGKQSREYVRENMPERYVDVLNELLYAYVGEFERGQYSYRIVRSIIDSGVAFDFIPVLCDLITRLSVNFVHIVGDIFDRGHSPHGVMEALIDFGEIDVQWGNHDVLWMGAAAGSEICMCGMIRANLRYKNLDTLENGYGLNLRALSSFAQEVYKDDPCEIFMPKVMAELDTEMIDDYHVAQMHKAIAVLEFKLESHWIDRNPELKMEHRRVVENTDWRRMVYIEDGKEYPLIDTNFPTIDPDHPQKLTKGEEELLDVLRSSFEQSETLHRHVEFLYEKGSTYKVENNNLLFHGCVPMTEDGEFDTFEINGEKYAGKALMDYFDYRIIKAYYGEGNEEERKKDADFMWYAWGGPKSPMFGKHKIATFERTLLTDKGVRAEIFNPYFSLTDEEEYAVKVMEEFGITGPNRHIINGHIPVRIKDGDKPIRANGKLFVIDGGISRAYHERTGIAGYTLIFNSHHLALAEHHDFKTIETDIGSYAPELEIVDTMEKRLLKKDTDKGKKMQEKVDDLTELIKAYRDGRIKEKLNR